MNVVFVLGTRPEITKTFGIISALARRGSFPISVIFTGQQTDLVRETIGTYEEFDRIGYCWFAEEKKPFFDPDWRRSFLEKFADNKFTAKVGLVIGTGDTNSVLAAAEAASRHGIPFLHLEAGIRHNREIDLEPEEKNRRAITLLSTFHFCPSASQRSTLIKEGIDDKNIFVSGDLSAASVATTWKKLTKLSNFGGNSFVSKHFNYGKKLCVCTFHRSTSLANIDALDVKFSNLVGFYPKVKFLICIRPDTRWKAFNKSIEKAQNVTLIAAPPPFQFQQLLAIADIVVTDSAGVQQESALFSKPCVALRADFELGGDDPLLFKVAPPFRDLDQVFLTASRRGKVKLATNLSFVRLQGEAMIDRTARMIEQLVQSKRILGKCGKIGRYITDAK